MYRPLINIALMLSIATVCDAHSLHYEGCKTILTCFVVYSDENNTPNILVDNRRKGNIVQFNAYLLDLHKAYVWKQGLTILNLDIIKEDFKLERPLTGFIKLCFDIDKEVDYAAIGLRRGELVTAYPQQNTIFNWEIKEVDPPHDNNDDDDPIEPDDIDNRHQTWLQSSIYLLLLSDDNLNKRYIEFHTKGLI